jgi:hypothetical protein
MTTLEQPRPLPFLAELSLLTMNAITAALSLLPAAAQRVVSTFMIGGLFGLMIPPGLVVWAALRLLDAAYFDGRAALLVGAPLALACVEAAPRAFFVAPATETKERNEIITVRRTPKTRCDNERGTGRSARMKKCRLLLALLPGTRSPSRSTARRRRPRGPASRARRAGRSAARATRSG